LAESATSQLTLNDKVGIWYFYLLLGFELWHYFYFLVWIFSKFIFGQVDVLRKAIFLLGGLRLWRSFWRGSKCVNTFRLKYTSKHDLTFSQLIVFRIHRFWTFVGFLESVWLFGENWIVYFYYSVFKFIIEMFFFEEEVEL